MRTFYSRVTAITALAVIAGGVSGVALASSKVESGSYSGTLTPPREDFKLSFSVSSNGKKVTKLKISSVPLYCASGGPPTPVSFAPAKISKAGTFTSTGKYVVKEGPYKGEIGPKLKITGKFGAGGTESGTVTTTDAKYPECSGKDTYSTAMG